MVLSAIVTVTWCKKKSDAQRRQRTNKAKCIWMEHNNVVFLIVQICGRRILTRASCRSWISDSVVSGRLLARSSDEYYYSSSSTSRGQSHSSADMRESRRVVVQSREREREMTWKCRLSGWHWPSLQRHSRPRPRYTVLQTGRQTPSRPGQLDWAGPSRAAIISLRRLIDV